MAGAVTYNTGSITIPHIYRATGGGVTFSANLTATVTFDYFTNTAVVNDAIYFGNTGTYSLFSDLLFNVGTVMAGTGITLAWEYWGGSGTSAWISIEKLSDDTNSFTTTGANRVKFPIQLDHPTTTVNSVSALWVRCRISALTTITEGGANQTTAVTAKDGKVNIDSYTDLAPCTWTIVYNYMTANYPYVGVLKNGNYFDFRRVLPMVNSRLVSLNETIEMCPSCKAGGSTPRTGITLDYLTNGTAGVSDTTIGSNGSTYIMNGIVNSYPFAWGTHHVSYDTEWRNPTVYSGGACGYLGYPSMTGAFYGCKMQMLPSAPVAAAIVQNCKFNMVSGFIATTFPCTTFLDNTFTVIGSSGAIFNIYSLGFTVRNLGFKFTSTGTIFRFNSSPNDGEIYSLINPLSRLPGNVSGTPMTITTGPPALVNLANVFFYDDSAGTFTSYTTQASSTATADVPINGDVGDCLYMDFANVTPNYFPYVTSTIGGTNDYVYIYEHYTTSGWTTATETWDQTNNFTQTGNFITRKSATPATVTINGVNSYWGRFRIVTKGTGTPSVDRIRRSSFGGVSDWSVHERYDIEFTGVDSTSTPVAGVEVSMTDAYGTVAFTGTSGALGTITPTDVLDRKWYFDPLDATRNTDTQIVEKSYNPYTTRVRKYGYVAQEFSTVVNAIQKMRTGLITNSFVTAAVTVVDDYTGITINGVANTITISTNHTIAEVYDYCQYWSALTANMPYAVAMSANGGDNYSSTYDLIVSSNLTGTGIIDISTNDLTLSGTSSLDIYAANGNHINPSSNVSSYGYIV